MRIYFATGNLHKLVEAKSILQGFDVQSAPLKLAEIQGSATDIAVHKARRAARVLGKPVFAEDTSLCFTALKGLPGPYIKEFILKIGRKGVVGLLHGKKKNARAVCTLCLAVPGREPVVFEGQVSGRIVAPRGRSGFGWDPIFLPRGYSKTFAQMGADEKNRISHRRKALVKLQAYLLKKGFK